MLAFLQSIKFYVDFWANILLFRTQTASQTKSKHSLTGNGGGGTGGTTTTELVVSTTAGGNYLIKKKLD